jgi:acyl-CoA thioesterase-1
MESTATMNKILRDRFKSLALAAAFALAGVAASPAAEQTLMLYGDSLMAGLGLSEQEAFAGRLQEALGGEVTIVNASVSGDTSAAGLARLDWSLAERPDAVVLELGANDMLQGLEVAALRRNLTAMLERFSAEGIPVLLVGMRASPSLGSDYVQDYEAVFPELAAQFDTALYPFFLDGVVTDASLNQADGMHPNAAGVSRIVQSMLPSVSALLRSAAGR